MTRFVDDSLLASADPITLRGSRCDDCGAHTFPRQDGCPRCAGDAMTDVALGRTGTLWSWTTQGFRPKAPFTGDDEPYAVGYVELPDQLVVEARLTGTDPARWRIGTPVRITTVEFRSGVETFAFAPQDAEEAG